MTYSSWLKNRLAQSTIRSQIRETATLQEALPKDQGLSLDLDFYEFCIGFILI